MYFCSCSNKVIKIDVNFSPWNHKSSRIIPFRMYFKYWPSLPVICVDLYISAKCPYDGTDRRSWSKISQWNVCVPFNGTGRCEFHCGATHETGIFALFSCTHLFIYTCLVYLQRSQIIHTHNTWFVFFIRSVIQNYILTIHNKYKYIYTHARGICTAIISLLTFVLRLFCMIKETIECWMAFHYYNGHHTQTNGPKTGQRNIGCIINWIPANGVCLI